jgi:hypothetical protein
MVELLLVVPEVQVLLVLLVVLEVQVLLADLLAQT